MINLPTIFSNILPEHHLNHFTADLSDQPSVMSGLLVFHIQKPSPFRMHNLIYVMGQPFPSNAFVFFFLINFFHNPSDREPQVK